MGSGVGKRKALDTEQVYVASTSEVEPDDAKDANPLAGESLQGASPRRPRPRVAAIQRADPVPGAGETGLHEASAALTGASPSAPSGGGGDCAGDDKARRELQDLTLAMLKRRAREVGATASDVDALDDATDPKLAAIEFILDRQRQKADSQESTAQAPEEHILASAGGSTQLAPAKKMHPLQRSWRRRSWWKTSAKQTPTSQTSRCLALTCERRRLLQCAQ